MWNRRDDVIADLLKEIRDQLKNQVTRSIAENIARDTEKISDILKTAQIDLEAIKLNAMGVKKEKEAV